MLTLLKQHHRLGSTLLLLFMSLFCVTLSALRWYYTGSPFLLFLNWNLFLAFIPWALSTLCVIAGYQNKALLALVIASWLLFFPNAPYILTDLFHLRHTRSAPVWYDLILILSFAWTGLAFGFISLMDIEQQLRPILGKRVIVVAILCLFLAGFGIYLGRFLRWNSWDIVSNPGSLLADITHRFTHPFAHGRTWGVTILMGSMLNLMYFTFRNRQHLQHQEAIAK